MDTALLMYECLSTWCLWGKSKSRSGLATAVCPWKQEVGAVRSLALGCKSQVDLGQAGMIKIKLFVQYT